MAVVEMQANGLPKVVESDGDEGNVVDLSKVEITPLGPPQSAPPRLNYVDPLNGGRALITRQAPGSTVEPLTAAQLKRDIRARLKVVRKEIALRKRLEREEQQLVRLLKAVSEKPTTVRPIRATG